MAEVVTSATAAAAGVPVEAVGAIVAAVVMALLGGGVLGKKVSDSSKTTIDPQPLMVKMSEEFVTRREFDNLENRMAGDVREMKGLFREIMAKIDERDERLSKSIQATAENAYQGRGKIWEKVNDQAARLKSVEDRLPAKNGRAANG